MAVRTSRVTLGVEVVALTRRRPWNVAREAARRPASGAGSARRGIGDQWIRLHALRRGNGCSHPRPSSTRGSRSLRGSGTASPLRPRRALQDREVAPPPVQEPCRRSGSRRLPRTRARRARAALGRDRHVAAGGPLRAEDRSRLRRSDALAGSAVGDGDGTRTWTDGVGIGAPSLRRARTGGSNGSLPRRGGDANGRPPRTAPRALASEHSRRRGARASPRDKDSAAGPARKRP